jgi:hypothetical protein
MVKEKSSEKGVTEVPEKASDESPGESEFLLRLITQVRSGSPSIDWDVLEKIQDKEFLGKAAAEDLSSVRNTEASESASW